MATNDTIESLFVTITHQLQAFGQDIGIHALNSGQTKINGDFIQDFKI